jgi:hypothetical protein
MKQPDYKSTIIMKCLFALSVALYMTLLGSSVVQAQGGQLEWAGPGTLTADGATTNARFEMWGTNGKTSLIKISVSGPEVSHAQISMTGYGADGASATGELTPCGGGGVCHCNLSSPNSNAGPQMTGLCSNTANPEKKMTISISNMSE